MLDTCRWLALEVKDLGPARSFYESALELTAVETHPGVPDRENQAILPVGGGHPGCALVLRRPSGLPRGGLHTHYALSIPAEEYDDWWDRLSTDHELWEYQFGSVSSLYCYDPDGNCVELAGTGVDGPGIDGVFEVVLEVADLERAVDFYADLGFEPYDREDDRVRLGGPVDLELWEPRLGLANARGGVHVDLGFETDDPRRAVAAVEDRIVSREHLGEAMRVVDPDGHFLTFVRPDGGP